jgi:thiol-disulfide isomerase/thioredoxin
MKRTKLIFTVTILLYALRGLGQNVGINFTEDLSWSQVKEKAAKENRNIFIDAYATWCGPCKKMDAQVYPNENVGAFINKHFISIKVQQDQTAADKENIKSWYNDATYIMAEYKVEAFPTLLFLTADGKLMHRAIGFHDTTAFSELASVSLTDPIGHLSKRLAEYKSGKIDYETLLELVILTRDIVKDKELSLALAKDYKENYLDKLSETSLLNKKYLDFIDENYMLLSSKDKFFKLFVEKADKVDQVKKYENGGWADFQILRTVNRELIDDKLWLNKEPITMTPDWDSLYKLVKATYPNADARKIILSNKVNFYGITGQLEEFAKYRDLQVKQNLKVGGSGLDAWQLNVHAWLLFEKCNNKDVLNKALSWSNLTIQMDKETAKKNNQDLNVQYYDTKANLLYKLGHVKDAIAAEQLAIQISTENEKKSKGAYTLFLSIYRDILNKMEKGEPTWSVPAGNGN